MGVAIEVDVHIGKRIGEYSMQRDSKQKIGVLTFVNTINYGAELQAYALVKAIHNMGYSAELINYSCPKVSRQETPRLFGGDSETSLLAILRNTLKSLLRYPYQQKRLGGFKAFTDSNIPLGQSLETVQDILDEYDCIVVGSDQVWSTRITGGDPTFLLAGNKREGQKIVSYAASFGDHVPNSTELSLFRRELVKFDFLGVREASGLDTLLSLGFASGRVNLDPTLLLPKETWCEAVSPSKNSRKYVFAYAVAESNLTLRYAKRAAEKLGVGLCYIDAYGSKPVMHAHNCGHYSPDQFLSLVENAELVVTSSFHGLCFSILFNKQFRYAISSGKKKSRLYNLVSELGFESYDVSNDDLNDLIDFSEANRKLEEMRAQSLDYLCSALL